MGLINKLTTKWKSMTTKQKVYLVIDILSGAGSGMIGGIIGNNLSAGKTRLERVCIKTATAGLGLAAGRISSQELREAIGDPLAKGIDRAKARAAEEKMKEAVSHE